MTRLELDKNNNRIMDTEIWKEIPLFTNYEASNKGRIRRAENERILKQQVDSRGYKVVTIWSNKKKYTRKVARLIWSAFNDECKLTVDHIDRDKHNNVLTNLRCISNSENCKNRTGHNTVGSNKYNLDDNKKGEIIDKIKNQKVTTHKIWLDYGIPTNYMGSILKRGTWLKYLNDGKNL